MADWATISSLATAGGTLVLAVATFSAVRSGNRSARIAERALLIGQRPVLMASRLEDSPEPMTWGDDYRASVAGGHAIAEIASGNIYLAMSLRNVGAGIAVLQGWHLRPGAVGRGAREHPDLEEFRRQGRDLYIAAGTVSFWQARLQAVSDEFYEPIGDTIRLRETITVHLLYSDHEGGQRAVTRFNISPTVDRTWLCSAILHWNLDRADPR
jgi:hypothetical protein